MYFDRPGLILLVSLATLGPLTGLAFVRLMNYITLKDWKTPPGVDAFFSGLTLSSILLFVGLIISATIAKMYDEYQDMKSGVGRSSVNTPQPERPRTLLDMNTGKVVNAFDTQAMKVDIIGIKTKRMCRTLINQREAGFEIDLREDTWKAHFGGRDNYVYVRDVKMAGAFAKEFARDNSPFVVVNWRIVEDGARGKV